MAGVLGIRWKRLAFGVALVASLPLLLAPAGQTQNPTATTLVPVGLDPVQNFGAVSEDGAGADLAFDGTNFMLVWHVGREAYATLLSPGGEVVGPGTITLESDNGWRPSVAFDGTNYTVFWVDGSTPDDNSRRIFAKRVSKAGVVLDAEPKVVGVDAKLRRISAAFDGTSYLVVWRTGSDQIRGVRVSTSAARLDDEHGFLIGGGFYPAVAAAGGEFLVVWHGHGNGLDVYGARVDDGSVIGSFTISDEPADQDHVSVATNGTDFMVGFRDGRFGNRQNFAGMSAVRVAADGTVRDDPPLHISDDHWSQGTNPTVAWDGTDWLAAWSEDKYPVKHRLSDLYARRVSAGGALLSEPIPLVTGFSHQVAPTFGVVGNRHLLAFMDRGPACSFGSICLALRLFDRVPDENLPPPAPGPAQPEVGVWERLDAPIEAAIHTVFAFGNDSAFAGTEPDDGPLLEWDGTRWSIAAYLPDARKYGIWGTSPTHLFAIGRAGNMALWDGRMATMGGNLFHSTGTLTPMATGIWGFGDWGIFLTGVDGVSARHVGTAQPTWENGACLSWDDGSGNDSGKWRCERIRGNLDNWDVWGKAPNDVYVVGERGTAAHFDGAAWALADVPTQQSLNGVWGSCSGETFAVGDFGTILHRQGTTWRREATPTQEHLFAVAGVDAENVYAVGNGGTILHYDGAAWSAEESGTTSTLEDVAVGESIVWAVGARGGRGFPGSGPGTILRKRLTIADSTAPENPVLSSPTHGADAWTPERTIEVSLEGGCDDGLGIDGFSVALDRSPTTVPPPSKNLDPGQRTFTGAATADGEWYFHVRTVDRVGNWSAASHLGPLRVDTTPPTVALAGSEPVPGGWHNEKRFRLSWSATDASSRVVAYSFLVSQSPDTVPDTRADFDASVSSYEVSEHPPGQWYFHLRAVDAATGADVCDSPCGNWSDTVHFGPFGIDVDGPTGPPTLSSPSHQTFVPSSDNTVDISLTGAPDDMSGVDGFSYVWDQCERCNPNRIKLLEETASDLTSPPLPDGDSWVHVQERDNAGNWSGTSTLGPFRIDTGAPSDPALRAVSHQVGVPSIVDVVEVAWSGAGDTGSGVDGFSYEWSPAAGTTPDALKDAEESASGARSPALAPGSWWFHLRTRDNAGNWTATVHFGPFLIERAVPSVPPRPRAKKKVKKVTLCHKGRTVKVPASQVRKHRKHGDKLGACKKRKKVRRR